MKITLACTWKPRGETPRIRQLAPLLAKAYDSMIIAVRDKNVDEIELHNVHPNIVLLQTPAPGHGRYMALQKALETKAQGIHYADLDQLVHWVETRPEEWHNIIAAIPHTDCLVIGRTERAFQTRPQAIQQTEQIINMVFSYLLGQRMDFGCGNRGFSPRAARYVTEHSYPPCWGDTEWPLMLHHAGMEVTYRAADGVTWESPDHYRTKAASIDTQQQVAETYDQDAQRWAFRVRVAQQIIEQGLDVAPPTSEFNVHKYG